MFHKDTKYGKVINSQYGHGFDNDHERLKRIITSRPKPPPRVLIGRWLFRLMVAALVIQTLVIIWLKWDSSICRALLIS